MNVIPELSVPESWSKTTLADVRRDDTTTLSPAKHPDERFELYSIPAHETGKPELVKGRDIGSAKKTLSPDTVLLSKINPRINRVWVVGAPNGLRQIGSGEWIAFCPIGGVVPQYLAQYLRQDRFRTYLASNVSGVGGSLMRVKASVVDPFPFALPSFREQQRIVECLDSYLTRLDDAVASLERVQAKLKAYRNSVLKVAVEGRLVPTEASLARAEKRDYEPAEVLLARILTERRRRWEEAELTKSKAAGKTPKDDRWRARYQEPMHPDTSKLPQLPEGWCWATTDQIFWFVTSGSRGWARYYSVSGATFIRIGNLDHDGIDLDLSEIQHVSPPRGSEGTRTRVAPGDVLISITADVGMIGLVRDQLEEGYINQHISLARPVHEIWIPYLSWFLAARDGGQKQLLALQRGATKVGLGLDDIRSVNVPMPPLSEQRRIVDEVERRFSVAADCQAAVSRNDIRSRRLRQAVLKWAFEGKLVDQDPTDEPAERLLARIRAERAAIAPTEKNGYREAGGAV
jgi:type I restriction enzyme S subunit